MSQMTKVRKSSQVATVAVSTSRNTRMSDDDFRSIITKRTKVTPSVLSTFSRV